MAPGASMGTSGRRKPWAWLAAALLLCASRGAAFSPPRRASAPATSLGYASHASRTDSGPMSKVDSGRGGGCPFLDTSYVHKTYAVPALFGPSDSRPIVLFDGECNLCNKFVQTLLKHDSCGDDGRGNLRFAALQSRVGDLLLRRMSEDLRAEVLVPVNDTPGEGAADGDGSGDGDGEGEERYKSMVVCGPEKTYIRSSAVFQILRALGGSKRVKVIQYLSMLLYVLPTGLRDRAYNFVSKRRKRWFGSSDECLLWDDRFEDRFVDDGVLTGAFRDPFADPRAAPAPKSVVNPFDGDSPPVRGDRVRVVWPAGSDADPSVSYDVEFPDGVCVVGAVGAVTTVDLPTRVVMRVDRASLGMGPGEGGETTMIAWVRPEEIAAI